MIARRPPRLRPGDALAIIAPAGPVGAARFAAGAARLADRYRLIYDEALFTRTGYLAGPDDRRLAELHAALHNPGLGAVLCARGGYGVMRLLPELRLGPPRIVAGFSDVTALHAASLRAGVVALHAPVLTQLGELDLEHAAALVQLLEQPSPPPPWEGLDALAPGRATGIAVGGNLEVVCRLVGTPWALPLDGAVLFIEEVGERPYRLDRALTQLRLGGLAGVAAIVVGDLVRCDEPDGSGPRASEVVAERLGGLGVPVLAGAPFGHGDRNLPFPLGGRVVVDASRRRVEFLDGAVE